MCKGPEAGPCLVCWRNNNEACEAEAEGGREEGEEVKA